MMPRSLCHRGGYLALIILLMCAGGCRKKPFITTVEQTPHLGLPGGMDHLWSIDVKRLRAREGFQKLLNALAESPDSAPVIEAFHKRIGFVPWEDIDQLSVAARGQASKERPLDNCIAIALGRFPDPETKLESLRKWLGEEYLVDPPPFKASRQQGADFKKFQTRAQSQYDIKLNFELNFAFPTENVMVFSFNSGLMNDTLEVMAGTVPGIQQDKTWLEMLSRPNMGHLFWGTGNLSPQTIRNVSGRIPALTGLQSGKQYFFDVSFGQDFIAQLGIVCDSIESATQLSASIKNALAQIQPLMTIYAAQLPESVKLLSKIATPTDLQTAKIMVSLPDAEAKALMNEWEAFGRKLESGALAPASTPSPSAPSPQTPSPTPAG